MNLRRERAVTAAMLRHRIPNRRRQRGYSLIEIVAAFVVLALGMSLAMQSVAGSVRQARIAAERTEAALLAQSLLDAAGVGERLQEGETEGNWDDRYDWTLRVEPLLLEEFDQGGGISSVPAELMRLELDVRWGQDGRRSARFVTLRALTPDPGQ